jgi:hypothetical protein
MIDIYLTGNTNLIAELTEEILGWPDLDPDFLADLIESPDTVMEMSKVWPW